MDNSEKQTNNESKAAGTVKLGPKTRLQRARDEEERAAILEGLPYEVGFAKPPKTSRYTPGRSGNLRGRPRGSENTRSIIKEEGDAQAEVIVGGKRNKISKRRLMIRQLANQAGSGDRKAAELYFELERKYELFGSPEVEASLPDARDLAGIGALLDFLGIDIPGGTTAVNGDADCDQTDGGTNNE